MADRVNLIFDADDTLWESNVLFERAIEGFIDHLAHPSMSRQQVREVLNEIERSNARIHGYGVSVFHRSLEACLRRLRSGLPPDREDEEVLLRLCLPMREAAVQLLPGVAETLRELGRRHRLSLLTKGDQEDQRRKLTASGLGGLFEDVAIVGEKDAAVYRWMVETRGLDPEATWMIGNSPVSDIWPALEAGIGAVLVPHPHTWVLEHRELPEVDERFLVIESIPRLLERF